MYTLTSSSIYLTQLEFYAFHGVSKQEQTVGNLFFVDLTFTLDLAQASKSDQLADTVSYAAIYEVIKREMSVPSKLLEHLCGRIMEQLFAEFAALRELTIRVEKRNPPMGAKVQHAGVEMSGKRS